MAFHLIRAESRPYLSPEPEAAGERSRAQRAVEVLGADYLRWSRIGLGLLAFVGSVVGASGSSAVIDAFSGDRSPVVSAFAGVTGLALLAVLGLSLWMLIALGLSGRRLVRSLAAWLAGPYRAGRLAASWAGWLHTRLLMFRPGAFVRIAAASCAALFGAYATYAFFETVAAPSANLVMYGLWAIIGFVSSVVLFSGSIRLISGRAEADRVWRTVRDTALR
ncbi:MAG: hypothetical protein VYC96_05765 [Actinomycetota bacterium]|nr:hypothetical protein [Actinomycetota bacterium]